MADVTMPQLGETVIEGTITRWAKKVGENVSEGELLFEVSTDKVDSEVTAPITGVLAEILVAEGETIAVGTKLATISADGAAGAPVADAPVPATAAAPAPAPAPVVAPTPAPVAQAPAAAAPVAVVPAANGSGNGVITDANGERAVLSPVVRRLINENGLDAASIRGTGAGGRITRADVLAVVDSQKTGASIAAPAAAPAAPAAPQQASPAPSAPVVPPAAAAAPVVTQQGARPDAVTLSGRDTVIPFSNIRRRTAEHMVMSKTVSPHAIVMMEIDFFGVDQVRNAMKKKFKAEEGVSLTYLPFIARALVDALREFPNVNASMGDNQLIVHGDVNLGIAVDLNFEGLLVPVVHGADQLRMRALARSIADVADRARTKRIGPDDLARGTFTITNLGGYGTVLTGAVINQPQVAILATDGVRKRPVVIEMPDGNDAIVVHPVGNLALTWDHRAFDGAYAAAFLARVRDIIETRDWSTEL